MILAIAFTFVFGYGVFNSVVRTTGFREGKEDYNFHYKKFPLTKKASIHTSEVFNCISPLKNKVSGNKQREDRAKRDPYGIVEFISDKIPNKVTTITLTSALTTEELHEQLKAHKELNWKVGELIPSSETSTRLDLIFSAFAFSKSLKKRTVHSLTLTPKNDKQ